MSIDIGRKDYLKLLIRLWAKFWVSGLVAWMFFFLYCNKTFVCLLAFFCITKKGAGSRNVIRQQARGTCTNCFPTTTTQWKNNRTCYVWLCTTTSSLFPLWSFFRPVSVDKSLLKENDNVFDPRWRERSKKGCFIFAPPVFLFVSLRHGLSSLNKVKEQATNAYNTCLFT